MNDGPRNTVDPEVARIFAEMARLGRPKAALGRQLGLDPKQINRLENGERRLQRHEHEIALGWLGLSPLPANLGAAVIPLPGLVPVYGWVGAASSSRLTLAEQNLRGYVPMHPNQANVRDPFALEVSDVSMSPRYEPGETIYIEPHRTPLPGQDCVVVKTDGEGLLKRFVRRTGTHLILYQLNPEGSLEVSLDEVEQLHRVVGRG